MRLDGPQIRSGRCGEETNRLHLPRIQPWLLGHPTYSVVAVPAKLSWLLKDCVAEMVLGFFGFAVG
jgi:hypothetical protein